MNVSDNITIQIDGIVTSKMMIVQVNRVVMSNKYKPFNLPRYNMKRFSITFFSSLLTIICMVSTTPLDARSKKSKSYTPKPAYSGLGKPSKKTGRIKIKSTSGHYKRTSKGYTRVNTYARS